MGTATQPALAYVIGHVAPVALCRIVDLSAVTCRSGFRMVTDPPPLRVLCSLQL